MSRWFILALLSGFSSIATALTWQQDDAAHLSLAYPPLVLEAQSLSAQQQQLKLDIDGLSITMDNQLQAGRRVIHISSAGNTNQLNAEQQQHISVLKPLLPLPETHSALWHHVHRSLEVLSNWPLHHPLDLVSEDELQTRRSSGLCERINEPAIARYGVFKDREHERIIGPYPFASGGCVGRCGKGCIGDGQPNNSANRFTLSCFDHDVCAEVEGLLDFECDAIFADTVVDFYDAQDCNEVLDQQAKDSLALCFEKALQVTREYLPWIDLSEQNKSEVLYDAYKNPVVIYHFNSGFQFGYAWQDYYLFVPEPQAPAGWNKIDRNFCAP